MTTADEEHVHIAMEAGPRERMKFALPQSLVSTALLATLAYGCLAQGGFHGRDYRTLLGLVAATSAIALLAGIRPRAGAWAVAAGFLSLSTLLSALDARALANALPTLALLGAMVAVTSIVDRLDDEGAAHVSFGLTMVGALVAATAWIGVAFRYEPWGRVSDGLWRGSSSLTYSNAAASLIGAILLIAAARALGDGTGGEAATPTPTPTPRLHRLTADLTLFVLTSGLFVTQSRAGIAATALGGLLLTLRLGIGRMAARVLVPGLAGLMCSAVVIAGSSTEADAQPARAVASLIVGLVVVFGWAFVAGSATGTRRRSPAADRRLGAKVLLASLGLAFVAVIGLTASTDNAFSDIVERRLTLSSNTASGEVVLFGDRSHEWSAAIEEFRGRPLLGVGPGKLQLRWKEADGSQYYATYVHNEYLELATTHGVLGIVAALFGGALVADEIRRRRDSTPLTVRWGGYAALFTLLAHSGLDYLWHLPLLPIVMSVIVGLLVRNPRSADHAPAI